MKSWFVVFAAILVMVVQTAFAAQTALVPKYDPKKEASYKGTVEEVRDHACPVSGGIGSHLSLKLADGSTMEVHLATTKFVKAYDLIFTKGEQVEVTGTKVMFDGAETILAREIRRG